MASCLVRCSARLFSNFVPFSNVFGQTRDVFRQTLLRSTFSNIVFANSNRNDAEFSDFNFDSNYEYPTTEIGNTTFWRRKMRTLHGVLDVNKDGVISYDDFKLLGNKFVELGHLSENQQNEFHALIKDTWTRMWGDINPYNVVTILQYLEDMKHMVNDSDRRTRVHQFLPYIFKAVDNNKDGIISVTEFQLFFQCVGLSQKEAVISFHSIDSNNNGEITLKEFVTLGRDFFLTEDETKPSKLFWGPLAN